MKTVDIRTRSRSQRLGDLLSSRWRTARSLNTKETLITCTIVLTILLFMYTAVSKLLEYDKFVFQMRRVPLHFIQSWAPFIGRAIPLVELVLVGLLFIVRTRYWGLICSLLLMVSFEIYILWMKILEMQTGIRLPCSCGGIISKMNWTEHLLFNAVFVFLLALSLYYERKKRRSKTA